MVIKRSPGGPCRWRAVNFEIHLWSSGMNADCIWRSISIQHVQIEAGLNSDPGNDSFWDKSVTLSMLIDLLTIVHVDQRRWRSHQLTSDLKGCLLFLKCLRWSSRKAVSVPTSVIGGLGAPLYIIATSDLVDIGPSSDPVEVHPVYFDRLTGASIRQAALRTKGAAGPSGMNADNWRRLCTAFKSHSNNLCEALADLGRRYVPKWLPPRQYQLSRHAALSLWIRIPGSDPSASVKFRDASSASVKFRDASSGRRFFP